MKKPLLIFLTFLLLIGTIPFQSKATVHTVTVADFSFSPSTVANVTVGDTIHFVWSSGNHTTTSVAVPNGASMWDSPINSQATTFDYRVNVAGAYSWHCSIHTTMTGSFIANPASTGISSLGSQSPGLKFFPNPAKSELNVSFISTTDGDGQVRIYDLTGKEVFRQLASIIAGTNAITIPLANLPSGMYMAELVMGTEQIGVRRIIKE